MHEGCQQQAQELCGLLDGVLAQIQTDGQADEDVKLIAFNIREDVRFFLEAVFWSELRQRRRNDRGLGLHP